MFQKVPRNTPRDRFYLYWSILYKCIIILAGFKCCAGYDRGCVRAGGGGYDGWKVCEDLFCDRKTVGGWDIVIGIEYETVSLDITPLDLLGFFVYLEYIRNDGEENHMMM